MPEIVRVLKWRLDLDAAGLSEGLGRAGELAKKLGDEAARVGDRGGEGLRKAGEGAKGAGQGLDVASLAAKNLEATLGRLEKGTASPLVLQRNAELAAAGLKVLESEAQKTGKAIDTAFSDRVAKAIQAATGHAKAMNAELEQMGGQTPTKLDKVITALRSVTKAEDDATSQARALATGLEKAAGAESDAAVKARALADALARMKGAENSPEELAKAAGMAAVNLEELSAAAQKAGVQVGGMGEALGAAESRITEANTRAAQLRDTMGDMRARGDAAAKGFESMAGSAGSLEGILGKLGDTGGTVGQSISKVGFAVIAGKEAFDLGYKTGRAFDEGLKSIGIDLSRVAENAGTAANRLAGYSSLLSALPTQINAGLRALQAHEQAASDAATALGKLGIAWTKASTESETLRTAIGEMDKLLVETQKTGENWGMTLQINADAIQGLAQRADELGVPMEKLPPSIRRAITEIEALTMAAQGAATATAGLAQATEAAGRAAEQAARDAADNQKWEAEQAKQREEQAAQRQHVADLEKGFLEEYLEQGRQYMEFEAERRQALREANEAEAAAAEALWDHKNSLDAYNQAIRENTEAWKAGLVQLQAVNWEIRHATQQTFELSDAQKNLVEELAKVSDQFGVASTWIGHFIAQLENDMMKGNVSLDEFRAKVERIIAALTQINAAGSGWMGDLQAELLAITRLLNDFEKASKDAAG